MFYHDNHSFFCSSVRNIKTTELTFEPSWLDLSLSNVAGDMSDMTRRTGVKRISGLRDFPSARSRFHTLFGQDPMHDFAEGLLAWFVQRVLQEFITTTGRAVEFGETLETVKSSLSPSLRWPALSLSELQGATHKLNGTRVDLAESRPMQPRF